MMTFWGKKFRRIHYENIDEMLKETNASDETIQMLKACPPVFSFTKVNDLEFTFCLECQGKYMCHQFTLGREHELEKRNGEKIKVTYQMEGDNVLNQHIKQATGKGAIFRREFGERETKMTITMDGSTKPVGTIYYEMVES